MGGTSHVYGIGKCGTDGGSDIYASSNRVTSGFVTVWVR
jgi:hypothetical protein